MVDTEIEQEIEAAAKRIGIAEPRFRRCGADEARVIQQQAMARFVRGEPRAWWLALALPFDVFPYADDGLETVKTLVPQGNDHVWFIPETEKPALAVYEGDVEAVLAVLGESFYFEYYLVGKSLDWFIADTDHNEVVVCPVGIARRRKTG